MTEYYIDEDFNLVKAPPTEADISEWANAYQKKYFPQRQPQVKIAINTNPKFGGAACFDPSTMTIHIAQKIAEFERPARIALLHEIIHVNLHAENGDADEVHGARFQGEVKRLINAGAYDGLL